MLSVKQGSIKYHFLSLVWLDQRLNSSLSDHWRKINFDKEQKNKKITSEWSEEEFGSK